MSYGVTFSRFTNLSLTGYCDADLRNDIDDRRSMSGSCLFFGNNLISWSAKKQTVVARSTAEAEYRSLATAIIEILWVQSFLKNHELLLHLSLLSTVIT